MVKLLMLWNKLILCMHTQNCQYTLFTQSWYFNGTLVLWCYYLYAILSTRYPLLAVGKHTITSTRYRYHMSQPPVVRSISDLFFPDFLLFLPP